APGGRAISRRTAGFHLNLGPHALYRRGEGAWVLAELDVAHRGGTPNASGGYALDRGVTHALPGGLVSLLTTGVFGLPAKLEAGRWLAGIGRLDPETAHHTSVHDWVNARVRHPDLRRFVHALVRLTSYANAPDTMSAGIALRQLQLALASNVSYLDGGWQTLVDGVRARAEEAGVRLRTSAAVAAVERTADGRVAGVRRRCGAPGGGAAGAPARAAAAAAGGLPGGRARRRAASAVRVLAACLDVALARLPRPRATFALGIDEPLYFSVHSAVARLAPEGGALIQVARYLGDDSPDPKRIEAQLEGLRDRLHPGWRDV